MKFFDLLPFHSSDISLKDSKQKKKSSAHILDLRKKSFQSAKKVTDILGKNSKRAFRYITSQVEHRFKELHRSLFRFGALAVFLALIFNLFSAIGSTQVLSEKVKTEVKESLSFLRSAANSGTSGDFSSAASFLSSGKINLDEVTKTVSSLLMLETNLEARGSYSAQGKNLLTAAEALTTASEKALYSADRIQKLITEITEQNPTFSITEELKKEITTWNEILSELKTAQTSLNQIDPSILPEEGKAYFTLLRDQLNANLPFLEELLAQAPALLEIFGDKYPRRYLILFQNKNEIRPTGGFIGSLALVSFNDGHLTELEIKDVYDFDGQIDETITPPPGFGRLTLDWGLRDSNYSPHFPTSAEQAAYFLEKGNGPTVDGVIAINQELVENLLKITGPIEVKGIPVPLTHQNFSTVITFFVETKIFSETDPKLPLKQFAEIFQDRLISEIPNNLEMFTSILLEAIAEEQILAWSPEDELQEIFRSLNIDGEQYIPNTKEDYLQIVRTNIAGNKSDFFTSDEVTHKTYIKQDGTIENQLIIRRTHAWQNIWEIIWERLADGAWDKKLYGLAITNNGTNYAENVTNRNSLPKAKHDYYEIFGRGANIDYTRIYLPKNSEIISVNGIKPSQITEFEDLNKKVVAFELTVFPTTTEELRLNYRLPYKLQTTDYDDYYLYYERQPGTPDQAFTKIIQPESGLYIHAAYPENITGEAYAYSTEISTDFVFGAVIGKN